MIEERPVRVWVDDENDIFRLGLSSCLGSDGFVVAGESRGLAPRPDLSRTDVLVFDLGGGRLGEVVRLTQGSATRLLAIAATATDGLLIDAVEAGVAGVLLRADVTPAAFLHCLRSVSRGNGSVPASALASLLAAPGPGRRPGSSGHLTGRELDVLRLLSTGQSTREIAADLSYSEKTVKNIVHDLLVRMNCRNRAQAVAMATQRGLI
ncbi:MAG: LuxR C-terminal-related transcriptional regulator [Acidimicrobiia bacterium]